MPMRAYAEYLRRRRPATVAVLGIAVLLQSACATLPKPNQVRVPTPIEGNTGSFLSPYTSDGTIAPWVRNARAAAAGSAIGGLVGRKAGEAAFEAVPLVGGLFGKKAGKSAGRAIALKLVGGESAMRQGSDLSFERAEDLAVFLYALTPTDPTELKQKQKVISLTQDIYPDVLGKWEKSLKRARLSKGESQVMPLGLPGFRQ